MEICDMCMGGDEMLCRNGGLIGVVTDGGFAEYILFRSRGIVYTITYHYDDAFLFLLPFSSFL